MVTAFDRFLGENGKKRAGQKNEAEGVEQGAQSSELSRTDWPKLAENRKVEGRPAPVVETRCLT